MTTQTLNTSNVLNEKTGADSLAASGELLGRVALAAIFLLAGINKIQFYDANAQFLASGGLPEILLPAVILFEIVGALALIAGFQTRLTALAFAGFSVVTALLYHNNLGDQMQFIMFFKNIAIAGGFLVLAANGPGRFSADAKIN